jgi:hypothetical protein
MDIIHDDVNNDVNDNASELLWDVIHDTMVT